MVVKVILSKVEGHSEKKIFSLAARAGPGILRRAAPMSPGPRELRAALRPARGWALPHGGRSGASLNPSRPPSLPRGVAREGSVDVSLQSGFPAWLRLSPHAQAPSGRGIGAPVSVARHASFRAGGGGWGSGVAEWNVLDRALLRSAVTFSGSEDLPGEGRAGSDAPAAIPGEGRVGLGDGRGTADVSRDNPMHPEEVRYAILDAEDTKELARLIETYRSGSRLPHHRAVSLLLFAPLLPHTQHVNL